MAGCGEPEPLQKLPETVIQYRKVSGGNIQDHIQLTLGRSLFVKPWVFSPAAAIIRDGLGPVFNERSCASCHSAFGPASYKGDSPKGLLLRLSSMEDKALPGFGFQLQPQAHPAIMPEGSLHIDWEFKTFTYPDGSTAQLRRPEFSIDNPIRALPERYKSSLRKAPSVLGMGDIDALSDESILAWADPDDKNNDGISGRANWLKDAQGKTRLGRFGLKANEHNLEAQVAAAFHGDMGITSPLYPSQPSALGSEDITHGGEPEVTQQSLDAVTNYLASLAVIENPKVGNEPGFAHFKSMGCAQCHRPSIPLSAGHPMFSGPKKVGLFSDLLLHDMGNDLADHRPDGTASGREWRTAPLWTKRRKVRGQVALLHDGRARNNEEAILWHGGGSQPQSRAICPITKADTLAAFRIPE